MRRAATLLLLASASACGPAFVSGTVGGDGIDSSDAIASKNSLFGIDTLQVLIGGGTSDLCSDLSKGILHKGASTLELSITDPNGLQAITYSVKGALVSAHAAKFDTACHDVLKQDASGGTIKLTKIDGETVEGSFDLTFDGGDELTGSFTASLCSDTSVDLKDCE